MNRRRTLLLAVIVVVALGVVLAVVSVFVLPEMTRRLAADQLSQLLGRATTIERVELNLLTRRFAVVGLRVAEATGPDAFLTVDRIDGVLRLLALARFDVRLAELAVRAPRARLVRTGPGEFNVSDLLGLFGKADPAQPPGRWTLTLDRVALTDGAMSVQDQAVAPPADWSIQTLELTGHGITTSAGREPGSLRLRAALGQMRVAVVEDVVKLAPVLLVGRVTVTGVYLARLRPYAPPDAPAVPERGRVDVAVSMVWKREPGQVATAYLNGDVTVDDLAVTQPGADAPFLLVRRAEARIARADLIGRSATLAAVEVDGLRGRARRDRLGRLDLLLPPEARRLGAEAVETLATAAPPEPEVAAETDTTAWRVRVERLAVRRAALAVGDEAVVPPRRWEVEDLFVEGRGLSTVAGDPPATATVRAAVRTTPLGGRPASLGRARLVLDLSLERPAARPDAPILGGDFLVTGLAWGGPDERGPAASLDRLALKVTRADVGTREVALADVRVDGLDLRATRAADGTVDLVTALERALVPAAPAAARAAPPGPPPAAPRPWRTRLDRMKVAGARVGLTDRLEGPAREWRIDEVTLEASGLSSDPADAPGTAALRARVAAPGAGAPLTMSVTADRLRLLPIEASAHAVLEGVDLRTVALFLPPDVPLAPRGGRLGVDLRLVLEEDAARARRAEVTGQVQLRDVVVAAAGAAAPLLSLPRLDLALRQADLLKGTVALDRVEVGGLVTRATRDAEGNVDVLTLVRDPARPKPAPARPAAPRGPPAAAPPAGRPLVAALQRAMERPWRLTLEQLALDAGRAEWADGALSPTLHLALTDLTLRAQRLAWPMARPATFALSTSMPGGGRTEVSGTAQLEPLDVQITMSTRGAPIEPYQAYFPFPARFSGSFGGDSVSEVQRGPDGALVLASRGSAWGEALEVRAPGAEAPAARVDRLDIKGIDFSWPNYALVDRIAFVNPRATIERAPDGTINLRTLFEPPGREPTPAPAAPAPAAAGQVVRPAEAGETTPGRPERREGSLLETIGLDFEAVALENGHLRFLDRTTTPALSQEVSALDLVVRGLSNVMGRRRTTLTARARVEGEGSLDLRGELSGIGETLAADLVGELTDYPLASVNPYAHRATGWVVERGDLRARVHYRIQGDQLLADHDLLFRQLEVEQAREDDTVERRLGLPLGLIVALLKDTRGEIDFTVPLKGSLAERRIDWTEAIWSGIKQALVKLIIGPFRSIGRALTGEAGETIETLRVDPVTFAAGSAVIAPAMETQLTRVADFLRRAPYVKLALTPVVTAVDVESLTTQEVVARVQAFQRERGIDAFPDAVRAYAASRGLAGPPPPGLEEQLARLRRAEPEPTAKVEALGERRLQATRERLERAEGIPPDRLTPAGRETRRDSREAGRVEFAIAAK